MNVKLHAVLLCTAALAGCAAPEAVTSTESPSTREYPTGSNIPKKNKQALTPGVQIYGPEALERMQVGGNGNQRGVSP